MEKLEVIDFIKEQLLADPTVDAGFIYSIASLAAHDDYTYRLMSAWMEEVEPAMKQYDLDLLASRVVEKMA